jgi:hypothetical protein
MLKQKDNHLVIKAWSDGIPVQYREEMVSDWEDYPDEYGAETYILELMVGDPDVEWRIRPDHEYEWDKPSQALYKYYDKVLELEDELTKTSMMKAGWRGLSDDDMKHYSSLIVSGMRIAEIVLENKNSQPNN